MTPEERAKYLQQYGFDPTLFDLDEQSGRVTYKNAPKPAPVEPVQSKPSLSSSIFGEAKRNIGGALGGTLAASALAAIGTEGLSLIPSLIAYGGATALGAFGGQTAQRGIEKAVLTPEQLQAADELAAQQQAAHPIGTFIGGAIPNAAFFRPSPKILGSGVKAIGKSLTGVTANVGEQIAARQIGIGAGLGAGQEVAGELIQGQGDFAERLSNLNPTRIAASGALGALLNEPTFLTRHIPIPGQSERFQSVASVIESAPKTKPFIDIPIESEIARQSNIEQAKTQNSRVASGVVEFARAQAEHQATVDRIVQMVKGNVAKDLPTQLELELQYKSAIDEVKTTMQHVNDNADDIKAQAEWNSFLDKVNRETTPQDLERFPALKQAIEERTPELSAIKKAAEKYTPEGIKNKIGEAAKKIVIDDNGDVKYSSDTPQVEAPVQREFDLNTPDEIQTKEDLTSIRNYIGALETKYANKVEGVNLVKNTWARLIAEHAGNYRGFKIEPTTKEIITPQGKRASGVALLNQLLAKVDPRVAGYDTWPHELMHLFGAYLDKYGTGFDKQLWRNGIKKYGSEEALVQAAAEQSVKLALQGSKAAGEGNWFSKFWRATKIRLGSASEKDYSNLLALKQAIDAPATQGKIELATGEKYQETAEPDLIKFYRENSASPFRSSVERAMLSNQIKLTPNKEGKLPALALYSKLSKLVPKDELFLLDMLGMRDWLTEQKYVSAKDVIDKVNEISPEISITPGLVDAQNIFYASAVEIYYCR